MKKFRTYGEFLDEALDPLKFLTQEQVKWCKKHIKGEWGVNEKGEVTVSKNLSFKDNRFDRFPVQFAPVKGFFNCSGCPNLVSLEGAPEYVEGDFFCDKCPKLTSLKGAPSRVGDSFDCRHCPNLTSLEGAPAHVGWDFSCSDCPKLTSLEGAPAHVEGDFRCSDCVGLTSLEGAPDRVGGDFSCTDCAGLTSLKGAPSHVGGNFWRSFCPKLPATFVEIIDDYNQEEIDWKQAHKLIHSETARKAHSIGLI